MGGISFTIARATALLLVIAAVAATTGYAGAKIGSKQIADNSIHSVDLTNGDVRGVDVKNGDLTGSDVKDGSIDAADLTPTAVARFTPPTPVTPTKWVHVSAGGSVDGQTAGLGATASQIAPGQYDVTIPGYSAVDCGATASTTFAASFAGPVVPGSGKLTVYTYNIGPVAQASNPFTLLISCA